MNIHAKEGHKVIFAYPDNGYDSDSEHARKHLIEGETYTVERTDVSSWSTRVYLKEKPGTGFNSVHFADKSVVDNVKKFEELKNKIYN